MVGHLIGAAGALSVMVCLLAIRDGVLPPTINLETLDPGLRPRLRAADRAPGNGPRRRRQRVRLRGQNCVVVMRATDGD